MENKDLYLCLGLYWLEGFQRSEKIRISWDWTAAEGEKGRKKDSLSAPAYLRVHYIAYTYCFLFSFYKAPLTNCCLSYGGQLSSLHTTQPRFPLPIRAQGICRYCTTDKQNGSVNMSQRYLWYLFSSTRREKGKAESVETTEDKSKGYPAPQCSGS